MRVHGKIVSKQPMNRKKRWVLTLRQKLYLVGFVVLLTLGGVFYKTLTQMVVTVIQLGQTVQKETGLTVEEVLLEGRAHTSKKALLKAAGIHIGQPILSVSLETVQENLMTLPWVKEARVERHLPDLLILRVTEYEPYALWQNAGKLTLISTDDTELKVPGPEKYVHLPKVIGAEALKKARPFLDTLKTCPRIWNQLLYAQYIGKRRWAVVLKNKTRIDFPEVGFKKSLEKLKRYDQKHRALDRFRVIDLRLPDKVTVRK